MKAIELRIGNLLHDEKGNVVIVRAIDGDRFVTFKGQHYHGTASVYIDRYNGTIGKWVGKLSGIPLTTEWLKNLGFKERGGPGGMLICDKVSISPQGDTHFVWLHTGAFAMTLIEIEVKTVHQLQNLFFALTGKELEVKM